MGTIALFGEAEKGDFRYGVLCRNLAEVSTVFGEPPEESLGIFLAVEALLHQQDVLFFRVHEEGLAYEDYLHGLDILKKQQEIPALAAICAPGVGSLSILDEITEVCRLRHTVVIVRESDFYDFLTEK